MQALGNDFVAVNGMEQAGRPIDGPGGWREMAVRLCDRHFGIGADGFFVALPSATEDFRMIFFNPDGTEDRCGNGLRCFGVFLRDEGLLTRCDLTIEAFGGPVRLRILKEQDTVWAVCVCLGLPDLEPRLIPTTLPADGMLNAPLEIDGQTYLLNVVSTGSPHAVVFVDELPEDDLFFRVSPVIENHPWFPEKISVMWTRLDGPNRAEIRIWERATGETLGCGTGAAAVAVARRLHDIGEPEVMVVSKGGEVLAKWDGVDPVTLTGPGHIVYKGRTSDYRTASS